jgi:hypothetical protein
MKKMKDLKKKKTPLWSIMFCEGVYKENVMPFSFFLNLNSKLEPVSLISFLAINPPFFFSKMTSKLNVGACYCHPKPRLSIPFYFIQNVLVSFHMFHFELKVLEN